MKIPVRPPEWRNSKPESVLKALNASDEVKQFVQRANAKYRHFDDLRFFPLPSGITMPEAWLAVKLSRLPQMKTIPFHDVDGKQFSYWLPEGMLQALHEVDHGGGGNLIADGHDATFFSGAREQIIISSLMEEAIATSQLEGAVTTRDEAKEMLRSNRKPKDKHEQMVLNSYRTIRMLRKVAEEPLSVDLLNRIQREITIGTLADPDSAGKFRTTDDKIVVVEPESEKVVFRPPNAELLPERVQKLVEFANAPAAGTNFIHPLVKASILHFWLAYEHPYNDGNGRTARALFYWYMLKHGYWLFEYLTISRILHQAPMQYYRSFIYTENDDNDLTYSLYFMLKVTRNAIKHLKGFLRQKQQESRVLGTMLRNYPGVNYRQRELLRHALKHATYLYTIQSHQHAHGSSYQTARTDLLDLVDRKLLVQTYSGKQLVFLPTEDLAQKIAAFKGTLDQLTFGMRE